MHVLYGQNAVLPSSPHPVKDLPYTATQWTTTTVPLANGTAKTTVRALMLARSSDGSVRREAHEPSEGDIKNANTAITAIVILDAAHDSAIFLSPERSMATVTTHPKAKTPLPQQANKPSSAPPGTDTAATDLGKHTVDGFPASGRRNSYTVLESEGGNKQPVTVTTDTWYSSDLHIVLRSETHDSKGRSTVITLTDLKRGEPETSLFTIPAGYSTTVR